MENFSLRVFTICLLAAFAFLFMPQPQAVAQSPLLPAQSGAGEQPPAGADYGAIADILEDEASRSALIGELRRLATGEAVAPAAAQEVSLARRVAQATNSVVERFVAEIGEAYARISAFNLTSIRADGLGVLGHAALDLGAVVVGVIVVMWILRLLAGIAYARASAWVTRGGTRTRPWLRRGIAALGCSALDLLIVAVGWIVGYVIALFFVGEGGRMDTLQALFLNAFLVIETAKVIVRLFFATRYDGLRLLPIRGEDAAYWYTWLSRAAGFIGYGLLVVVPVVAISLGAAIAGVLSAAIHAIALLMAVVVIRQNRLPVKRRLQAMADRSTIGFARMLLGTLARVWHILAIAYVTVLVVMLLVRPDTALSFMVAATLQTVVALIAGMVLSALIDKAVRYGIRLKPEMRTQFPMLEERLNSFVPTTLKVTRIVIAVIVAALVLDAWNAFDLFNWIASDRGLAFVGTLLTIVFILAATVGIWLLVSSWIEYRLNLGSDGVTVASSARERTLLTIFRNAFTISLVVVALMITLSELGLDIGPLLAGAGVLGLAIGFGAQKLVQDVITGVFIQLENAIYTGDVVTAAGITGVVEKLTVRSVGLRDLSGTYHLIPFSSVDTVSNFMRGFAFHVGEYRVAYVDSVDEAIVLLQQAFEELKADPEHRPSIIDDLEVHGVTELAESFMIVRVRIKTLPGFQWAVGRAYNAFVKRRFEQAGLDMPSARVRLSFGDEGQGLPQVPAGFQAQMPADEPSIPPARKRRTSRRRKPEEQDIPSDDEI